MACTLAPYSAQADEIQIGGIESVQKDITYSCREGWTKNGCNGQVTVTPIGYLVESKDGIIKLPLNASGLACSDKAILAKSTKQYLLVSGQPICAPKTYSLCVQFENTVIGSVARAYCTSYVTYTKSVCKYTGAVSCNVVAPR